MFQFLVADEQGPYTQGISGMLANGFDCRVYEANSSDDLLRALQQQEYDLILTSMGLPGTGAGESIFRILEMQPETKLIALNQPGDESDMLRKFRAGAHGYTTKCASGADIVKVAERVLDGCILVSHLKIPRYFSEIVWDRRYTGKLLSAREEEILQLICEGLTSEEIAEKLCISPRTVHAHRRGLMKKTGSASLLDLMKYALKKGIFALSSISVWLMMGLGDVAEVGVVMG
jgi:DNA-binding NarL/FixJ family response regulator